MGSKDTKAGLIADSEGVERPREILDSVPLSVIEIDLAGKILYGNPAYHDLLLVDNQELIGSSILDRTESEEERQALTDFLDLMRKDQPSPPPPYFSTRRAKNGSKVDLQVDWNYQRDGEGNLIGFVAVLTDVTERIAAEEALQESEARYKDLIDRSPDVVWRMNRDGVFTFISRAIKSISGFDPEGMVGLTFDEFRKKFVSEASRDDAKKMLERRQRGGFGDTEFVYELTCNHKDGGQYTAEFRSFPVLNENGEIVELHGIMRDITEAKLAREKLSEALANARRSEGLVNLGTYEWDWEEDKLVACSEEYARIHEMSVDEALQFFDCSEADYSYIHPDDREGLAASESEALAKGQGFTAEYRMTLPSGRICHLREVCEVELNDRGEVIRSLGSLQDVTEQVQLEEQFRQAQKMEAVGQLAGGIAHDFNNLLTAINGYSDLLLEDVKPGDPWHHNLSEIKNAGERAAALTRQLLAFGRKQVRTPKVIKLDEIVVEMESMLRRLIGGNIELQVRCDPDLKNVKADPGQMEQIIMNLVLNARDAMLWGGNITMSVENVKLDDHACAALVDLQAGDYIMLTVSDTGIGMDEETLSHVFEPFYTTKEVEKGSGLGLSTVFGIVKQSSGEIEVESEPGKGSTFRIYLPQAEASELIAEEKEILTSPIEGGETILLVEDEDIIRELLIHILKKLGYTVLTAQHGGEALLTAKRHEGPINLMITDIAMPQMSGHELAERFATLRPEMSVLYISGYDEEILADQGLVDVEQRFLQKPFGPKTVARKIREILDKSASSR